MDIKLNEWQVKDGIKFRIMEKSKSKFMRMIAVLVSPFNKTFMTSYVTTIGRTIYVPGSWIKDDVLEHELVHVKQWAKWNILFSLSYLLLLPAVFTMRGYWEKQAYKVSIIERHKKGLITPELREHMIDQFTSSNYLWMCPFRKSMEKWFDGIVKGLNS